MGEVNLLKKGIEDVCTSTSVPFVFRVTSRFCESSENISAADEAVINKRRAIIIMLRNFNHSPPNFLKNNLVDSISICPGAEPSSKEA